MFTRLRVNLILSSWKLIFIEIHSRIGTSRPALYHVLYDENGFSSDDIQQLTYWVCFIKSKLLMIIGDFVLQ